MSKGVVKWFNREKGFGFITPDEGGRDIYIHVSNLVDPEQISDGQRVEYDLAMGRKGPEAKNVRTL